MIALAQAPKLRGAILYEGPSRIDGAPIVVVATFKSENRKTGNMVQTWILRADVSPVDAVASGDDDSICGDCPHRGDGTGKGRTCYVNVGQAPLGVWRAYRSGSYAPLPRSQWATYFGGRRVRFGAYGDPAAVPLNVIRGIASVADGHTGYTHQWRRFPGLRALIMASADSMTDAREAQRRGWRTFRVRAPGMECAPDEIECPASDAAGNRTTCERCGLCAGSFADRSNRIPSISIEAHGGIVVNHVIRKRCASGFLSG